MLNEHPKMWEGKVVLEDDDSSSGIQGIRWLESPSKHYLVESHQPHHVFHNTQGDNPRVRPTGGIGTLICFEVGKFVASALELPRRRPFRRLKFYKRVSNIARSQVIALSSVSVAAKIWIAIRYFVYLSLTRVDTTSSQVLPETGLATMLYPRPHFHRHFHRQWSK